jgi:gluconokinase
LDTRTDGTSVVDPDVMVADLVTITDTVVGTDAPGGRVAAVALDTFASSVVRVAGDSAAVTPCFT